MKPKQKTREELVSEIAVLTRKNAINDESEKYIRKEFAKAFNWSSRSNMYGSNEFRLPSWEEIFTEIGRLLATSSMYRIESELSNLQQIVATIRKEVLDNKDTV